MTANRLAFWTLYAVFLTSAPGCSVVQHVLRATPDPIDAQCDAQCYLPCDPPLDLADGDGNTLLAVSKVNRAFLVNCTIRHDACRTCLQGLKNSKVIQ